MKSIRRYLTWNLLAGLFILLAMSNLLLYGFVHSRTVTQFDQALESRARAMASMMEQKPNEIELDFKGEFMPEFDHGQSADFFQVWVKNDHVFERSHSLDGKDLPRQTGPMESPKLWNLTLPNGKKGRAIGVSFIPESEENDEHENNDEDEEEDEEHGDKEHNRYGTAQSASLRSVELVIARDRAELDATLNTLLAGSIMLSLMMLTGIGLLIPRILRKGLQPLSALSRSTESIDSRSLDFRFPKNGVPKEIQPISERLNALLGRLEGAFEREKRLTADMAHELKTPIAELKTLAEVAVRWPKDEDFMRKTITDALDISEQMEGMVSTLLALARCEAGRQSVAPAPVELTNLLSEAWKPWEKDAAAKNIRLEFNAPDPIQIQTDKAMLTSILSNLFSNAVEYCPSKGRFECRLEDQEKNCRLTLTNTNDSLREEDLAHLPEPLWRKDRARSDGAHGGLGLALVASFTHALKIEMQVELTESNDLRLVLNIPHNIAEEKREKVPQASPLA